MFSKPLKRKKFSLSHQQIVDDLAALNNDPEQRNKLYMCVDDKVPENNKFKEMDNFVKDSQTFEELSETLKRQVSSLQSLSEDILKGIDGIKERLARR
ncbi:hypothetical protein RN001_007167 [Aquatica leii]|uniref:Uncharacterized protein n=1 Tax=Aquatica leii TaxID=1421715 RepID=A0AAN7PCR4_9COLE|nr:hypothetical protein RN001_007167 [Aquatica leii]